MKDVTLERNRRLIAHIICESLGYATPEIARQILEDAASNRNNLCEWIYSCFGSNPRKAVEKAIKNRHHHKGYMADYKQARKIVDDAIKGNEPLLASWF